MAAKYSIVQYVPDPIAGERINIGVITWNSMNVHARFVENWARARQFGGENPEFLRDFADKISILSKGAQSQCKGPAFIEKIIGEWHESIQFTPPRGSLDDADALLNEISHRVLHDASPTPVKNVAIRTKSFAARTAYRHVYNAMKEIVPDKATKYVKRGDSIRGELVPHKFDVVVGNGSPFAGVRALSFEVHHGDALLREIDATAWAIDDVRKRERDMPLAVFALPPAVDGMHALFERASKTFRGLNAAVVITDLGMTRWSHAQAEAIGARQTD